MGSNKKLYRKFILDINKLNELENKNNTNDWNLSLAIDKHCSWMCQVRNRYKRYKNTNNPIIYFHLAQKIAEVLEVDISELGEEYDY